MFLLEKSISDRFEQMVQLFPSKVAVRDQGGVCSYDELNREANRVARMVAVECASRELPVVLLLEQGLAQIAATMGVLKAGGFYVPMDPSNPAGRNRHMLSDSGAELIITNNKNRSLAEKLSQGACQVVNVDEISPEVSDENLNESVSPDTLAYVLYTSGSTGTPKGVMHNHRNVLHNVKRHIEAFNITHEDNQTLLYTSSVYGGQRDMFNALLNGASLHVYVVKNEGVNGLAEWLVKNDITIYCSVATVFRMFIQTLDGSRTFEKLRWVKLGGEASFKRDIDSYQTYFSDECVVHCGLGSTETGLVRNFFVSKTTEVPGNQVPLGYPVDGVDIQLLDETGQPAAAGEMGEIAIKSRYISLGYWRNPSLTATVFSQDPEEGDIRIYRTGDLGVIHPDGCLEHRGRKDFQIKIKGNRVEVAEIELVLLRQKTVKEAVVVGWKDPQGTDKLVAYLVPENPAEKPSVGELRNAMVDALPVYMVPSFFIWLDELPLLPNGKINRKELPCPDTYRPDLPTARISPATPLESRLTHLWEKILSLPKVGVTDNFFDLGGESLNAVTLFSMIGKEMGVNLPISSLVENPTVRQLAEIISDPACHAAWKPLVPLRTTGTVSPLFLVHAEQGNILFYRPLLPYLSDNRPVYALQSERLDGKRFAVNSVGKLAESYRREIETVQPNGPYFLGGYSYGGHLALEVAKQLQARGETVSHVFLFDTIAPLTSKITVPMRTMEDRARRIYHKILRALRKGKRAGSASYIANSWRHRTLRRGGLLPSDKRIKYLMWNHKRIKANYCPAPYSGDAVLFYTAERSKRSLARWRSFLCGNLKVHRIPGAHVDVFKEPTLGALGALLDEELSDSTSIGNAS